MSANRRRRHGALFAPVLGLAAMVLLAGAGRAATPERADDMALGNPRAQVSVVEYASVGCPHCGEWARDVFPAFRKTYIDSGKVRFVFREMLYGDPTLAAAGFLTARCAGKPRYFQVVDAIFAAQPQIAKDGNALASLRVIARNAGLGEARFNACLGDAAALAALQVRSLRHETIDKVVATPTFVVGGRRMEGDRTLADLGAAIAAARSGGPGR